MIKHIVLLLISIMFLSCAPQQQLIKPTSSGYPEGIFHSQNLDDTRSKIINGCMMNGFTVYESNMNQVICGKKMEGGDAVLAGLIIGNSYSTPPQRKIRFVMVQLGSDTKVMAQEWIETQMAFGQIRQQPLTANHQKNGLQQFLFSLGSN